VTNACLPAEERPNKTTIFISGVSETRSFLNWLRASYPDGLMAQLKAETLMVDPSTANVHTATVSALHSLDGRSVCFHTFTVPEKRCARLLVKNLSSGMPESVVGDEHESLDIRVQAVTQLRSGRRDQYPANNGFLTSHFIVSVTHVPEVYKMRSITELCGLRLSVETYVVPNVPLQSAASASGKRSETANRTPVRHV